MGQQFRYSYLIYIYHFLDLRGRRGRDRMVVVFKCNYVQSVGITTKVVSSNPVHGEVYSISTLYDKVFQ